jgi:hypothetical protein
MASVLLTLCHATSVQSDVEVEADDALSSTSHMDGSFASKATAGATSVFSSLNVAISRGCLLGCMTNGI